MSDVFSLAPEGQAWTDDKTAANPARPEDYEPTFFQGQLLRRCAAWLKAHSVLRSLPSDSVNA
jgi:hypothetical protein